MKIGEYELLGEIGRGGMGAVLRARSSEGRIVAIKLLARPTAASAERFERERRLLSLLGEAQGFVPLLDAGESPRGPYIVMPLLEGGTLRHRLARGPLAVAFTIELALALAKAIAHAHERGIVHRDLKPENILFRGATEPLIADLGLAKHFQRDADGASQSVQLTEHDGMLGTAGYIAPELLTHGRNAGPPADVFALGAIIYECLAGRPLFVAPTLVELLVEIGRCQVPPLALARPETPPWLAGIVERALAADARKRFPDGSALAAALASHAAPPRASSLGRVAAALACAAVLLGAGVFLGARFASQETEKPGASESPAVGAKRLAERAWSSVATDPGAAIAIASSALSLDDRSGLAYLARGAARRARGERDGARADLDQAVELSPGNAHAWLERGVLRAEKGSQDGALADLSRAIELDPRLARAWLERARVRSSRDDREGEAADLSRAIELGAPGTTPHLLRSRARKALGQVDAALADADATIRIDPRCAEAHVLRGTLCARKGDSAAALSCYDRAIENDPSCAEAWARRAFDRLQARDTAQGGADADRACALDPRNPLALVARAALRRQKGDSVGALADLDLALEADRRCTEALRMRAALRIVRDDRNGAIADSDHAIAIDPHDAQNWAGRGLMRTVTYDLDGAFSDYSRALALDPRCVPALYGFATILDERGQAEKALPLYERFLENAPADFPTVAKVRARVAAIKARR
ncbi:protein kinase [bacterium]|nr:protein kinase [bacterium]